LPEQKSPPSRTRQAAAFPGLRPFPSLDQAMVELLGDLTKLAE
jgi:hypothetical protein